MQRRPRPCGITRGRLLTVESLIQECLQFNSERKTLHTARALSRFHSDRLGTCRNDTTLNIPSGMRRRATLEL